MPRTLFNYAGNQTGTTKVNNALGAAVIMFAFSYFALPYIGSALDIVPGLAETSGQFKYALIVSTAIYLTN